MNAVILQMAKEEAKRFLQAADKVKTAPGYKAGTLMVLDYNKESAACKRASLDLTRALAELRRSG